MPHIPKEVNRYNDACIIKINVRFIKKNALITPWKGEAISSSLPHAHVQGGKAIGHVVFVVVVYGVHVSKRVCFHLNVTL